MRKFLGGGEGGAESLGPEGSGGFEKSVRSRRRA